jgi:hypothetical protein
MNVKTNEECEMKKRKGLENTCTLNWSTSIPLFFKESDVASIDSSSHGPILYFQIVSNFPCLTT